MATFGELQTSVSKRLIDANNTSVSAQDVATSLNDTIAYWKKRRFWFNETEYSDTLTQGNTSIPLPDDFLLPAYDDGAFFIEYSQMRYPLRKLKSTQYDWQYLHNGTGLPRWYANISGEWVVYFVPDQNYTIHGRYLKDYEQIAQDNYNAENDFTIHAPRLLVLWTTADLIAELRQDEKMEAYFRNAANNEYNQLLMMTRKTNASGRVTNHSIL